MDWDWSRIRQEIEREIAGASDLERLEEVRIRYLGKKGFFARAMAQLGQLPPDEKPAFGRQANTARREAEEAIQRRLEELQAEVEQRQLAEQAVDITLPGVPVRRGHLHPLYQVADRVKEVFLGMGFRVAEGPEVEYDWYNFEALNIPRDHPSRDAQESLYVTEDILLRTQTSPVQIRVMQKMAPELPVKIIAPGKVYRRDTVDPTHSFMFHQVEGLLVDRGVTMANLKGVLEEFARQLYGADTRVRLRPSYFPFTEPSAELDASCPVCRGAGCAACGGSGWLELAGCGMVHPRVLQVGGYDPEQVTGFAFGMGLDRLTMLKFGISDMRLLFQNDMRFLEQF
ncbi:MAG TPA: phenylalanine--tRNA ligase subunit alpha [Firmicutes bacterium]|nr:phenylalanine--tRNA ligase subunit alpha [Bacillota bacterium]